MNVNNRNKVTDEISAKINNELDCINLIRSIRELKAHLRLCYSQNQLNLLAFYKSNFISKTEPFTIDFSENVLLNKLLSSKSPGSKHQSIFEKHSFGDPQIKNELNCFKLNHIQCDECHATFENETPKSS